MPNFIKIVVLVFELLNFGKQTDIHLLLLGYHLNIGSLESKSPLFSNSVPS